MSKNWVIYISALFTITAKNECKFYSISNKKSFTINQLAKLFDYKIRYLPYRKGERYASALSNLSLSNKMHKYFGKINLENYIQNFLKKHQKNHRN